MKLIHRIGYYLGGFAIGLVILAFFLGGKKASCSYGPNARTIKNIGIKKHIYSEDVQSAMLIYDLDTLAITDLIKTGDVNFSESETRVEGCKTYLIENALDDKQVALRIKNCDSSATIQSLIIK